MTYILPEDWRAKMIPPQDEPLFLKAHGVQKGRTLSLVVVQDFAVWVEVRPTAYASCARGRCPSNVITVSVQWNGREYICVADDPDATPVHITITKHGSFKSALRYARKKVTATAPQPPVGWTISFKLPKLKSLYPSAEARLSRLEYEESYHLLCLQEEEEELERELNDFYPPDLDDYGWPIDL